MSDFTTGTGQNGLLPTPLFLNQAFNRVASTQLRLDAAEQQRLSEFASRGIPPLVRTEMLALLLGVSHKLLFAMARAPEKYYRSFRIPKRGGGFRDIATPRVFLKVVQRWIYESVLVRKRLPGYVTGFVPGGSIVRNASVHIGQRYVLKIDIENFFPSIGREKISAIYAEFGFPQKVVHLLTSLSLLDGRLPQGAPTSPCLANAAFLPVDAQVFEVADSSGIKYSRYADDLTFSSNRPFRDDFRKTVERFIGSGGFRINRSKVRMMGPGQRLITTGLVLSVKAHPIRETRRQLRARFHQAKKSPREFSQQANQLLGWAAFVNAYDPVLGAEYLRIARNVQIEARERFQG